MKFLRWLKGERSAAAKVDREFELLFARVGGAFLYCQIIERNLHGLLHWAFRDSAFTLDEWVDYGKDAPQFRAMIVELRQRVDLPTSFADALDEFRVLRNKFVHRLFEIEGITINTSEGRANLYRLAAQISADGKELNEIFRIVFSRRSTELGLGQFWPAHTGPT